MLEDSVKNLLGPLRIYIYIVTIHTISVKSRYISVGIATGYGF
jgi:hypothetical protein